MIATSMAVTLVSTTLAGLLTSSSSIDFDGKAERDSIDVVATDGSADGSASRPRNTDGSLVSVERRAALGSKCAVGDTIVGSSLVDPCAPGQFSSAIEFECDPGEIAREPVAERTWTNNPDGSISNMSDWRLVSPWECIALAEVSAAAQAEFTRLPVAPSPVTVQPGQGWTLVNIPTITYTNARPQVFTTTLLGIAVTIEAAPHTYTWDYGDNTDPLTTTDPGAPYPDHTIHHTYTQPTDTSAPATITLTTTWTGRFQITGAPTWTPITGTATTTTTAPPLTIHEARSRLVTDPLD